MFYHCLANPRTVVMSPRKRDLRQKFKNLAPAVSNIWFGNCNRSMTNFFKTSTLHKNETNHIN